MAINELLLFVGGMYVLGAVVVIGIVKIVGFDRLVGHDARPTGDHGDRQDDPSVSQRLFGGRPRRSREQSLVSCRECGLENDAGFRFCGGCVAVLPGVVD